MKPGKRFVSLLHSGVFSSFGAFIGLFLFSAAASARQPTAIPEPSLLALVGAGVVVAIIAKRLKDDE